MKDIKFNYAEKFVTIMGIRGGGSMQIISIDDIDVTQLRGIEKKDLSWIQIFDSGYRVTKTNVDWATWNGCIFVDIDTKKYCGKKNIKWRGVEQKLYADLNYKYNNNFYFIQRSFSGNSFHVVFYFDVLKNENNFKRLANWTLNVIKDWFIENDMEDVIIEDGVLDDCGTKYAQPLYISCNQISKVCVNYEDEYGRFDINDTDEIDNVFSDVEVTFKKNNNVKRKEKINWCGIDDCSYQFRWRVTNVLCNYFKGDKQSALTTYASVVDDICQRYNQHNVNHPYSRGQLLEQFKNDYDRTLNGHYGMSVKALEFCEKNFGIKSIIKREFKPREYEFYKPDETLYIKRYLSEIDWKFEDDFIHIDASCGVGKTFMTDLIRKEGKRVCFISPMTSILKDSFDDKNGWLIIDERNIDIVFHICGSVDGALMSGWSIATTWESFHLHEMWKYNFDLIFFDEAHTLYMYDYRIRSVRNIKSDLHKISCPVVMMTGTPSYEINEFDFKRKIKVRIDSQKVPSEILFYHDNYKAWVNNDIVNWINQDKNNIALIFSDGVNYKTEDELSRYGVECDIFNKSYTENVDFVLSEHTIKNQVTAFSVYGQAGINIYVESGKKARVYILNTNALAIIQYANRIRNKECIDNVIIPFKISNIRNSINALNDVIDYESERLKFDKVNMYQTHNGDVISIPQMHMIEYRMGYPDEILDRVDGQYYLNEQQYKTWKLIKEVNRFEQQIQIIYNRLVDNGFEVKLHYLDEDVKDTQKNRSRMDRFSGIMMNFDWKQVRKMKKKDDLWIAWDDNYNKVCGDKIREKICNIINIMYSSNHDIDATKQSFESIVQSIIRRKGTITKHDISNYSDGLSILHQYENYIDNELILKLCEDECDINRLTATYTRYVYADGCDWRQIADDTYNQLKHLREVFKDLKNDLFTIIVGKGVNQINVVDDSFTQEIYEYICSAHTRGRKQSTKEGSRSTRWRKKKSVSN